MASGKAVAAVVAGAFVLVAFLGLSFVTGFGLLPFPKGSGLGAGFGIAGLFFLLVLVSVGLVVWAIVDALVRPDLTGLQRLVWILIAFFVNFLVPIGAIAYLVMGRERTAKVFEDLGRRPPA